MQVDDSQAKYRTTMTDDGKASAEKMSKEIVDVCYKQSPETFAGLVVSALENEKPAGVESSPDEVRANEQLTDDLKEEIGKFLSDAPKAKEARESLTSFLAPLCHHFQNHNLHNTDPKQYRFVNFVDDLVGTLVGVQNKACATGDQQFSSAGRDLVKVLHLEDVNTFPWGKSMGETLRSAVEEKAAKFIQESSRMGKTDEAVKAEYNAKLSLLVGADDVGQYEAACGVLAEQIMGGVARYLTEEKTEAAFIVGSSTKKLIESLLLQALVSSLENSPEGGEGTSRVEALLAKIGRKLGTFMDSRGDKIREILRREKDPFVSPQDHKKVKTQELSAEFAVISKVLFSLVSAKPKEGVQAPFILPLAKFLDGVKPGKKSLWNNIGEKIVPGLIATSLLESDIYSEEKEQSTVAVNRVPRFDYAKAQDGNYEENVAGEKIEKENTVKYGALLGTLAGEANRKLPSVVSGLIQNDAVFNSSIDAIIELVSDNKSAEGETLAVFLKDVRIKGVFKTQLLTFLEKNPGLFQRATPLITEYMENLVLHVAKSLIVKADNVEKITVEGGKKKLNGDRRVFANIGLQLLENISDHFQAIEDVCNIQGKSWAHQVDPEEYMKFFEKGVPQTTDMLNARIEIAKAEGTIRQMRKELDKTLDDAPTKKIEGQLKTHFETISRNKAIIRNEEKLKYLTALKRGKQDEYVRKLQHAGRILGEVTYHKLLSNIMPQTRETPDTSKQRRNNIKAEERLITQQRELLKKAKTVVQKKACLEKIDASQKKIDELNKPLKEARVNSLKPFIEKILELIEMGKEDQIPLPGALRAKLIDMAKTKGAVAMADFIERLISPDNISEAFLNIFEDFNDEYYKTNEEIAEVSRLNAENRKAKMKELKKEKAERGIFRRVTRYIGPQPCSHSLRMAAVLKSMMWIWNSKKLVVALSIK